MNEVILSIGSNVTPRRARVAEAMILIHGLLTDCVASEIYETPEIHGLGRPYMNAVIYGRTGLDCSGLKDVTKRIEVDAGRDDAARNRGDVPVDIDIVVWNGDVVRPNDYRQSFFRIGAGMIGVL